MVSPNSIPLCAATPLSGSQSAAIQETTATGEIAGLLTFKTFLKKFPSINNITESMILVIETRNFLELKTKLQQKSF